MNPVIGGVILVVYVFIVIGIYFFVSTPFDDIMTNMEDLDKTNSDAEIEYHATWIRVVFDMMFGGLVLAPVFWYIYWIYQRQPEYGMRR